MVFSAPDIRDAGYDHPSLYFWWLTNNAARRSSMNHLLSSKPIGIAGLLLVMSLLFVTPSSAAFLTFVEIQKDGVNGVDGLNFVQSVAISLDGKHIYAASWIDNAVAVFSRNASTGALTFVEMQKDGIGGVDGLASAYSVTVSLDGKHVYVAGESDDAVSVFSRNASTGALAFVEVQKDSIGGVDGLDGARSVTVSPDGNHVYAAGAIDDAVAVFSRSVTTGMLTFVEVQRDSVGGVDGLDGARSVTTSPDGKHIYVAGEIDDAVAVFSRTLATGSLTFVQVQKDQPSSVDGLDGAQSVTVSPDNLHVYVTGFISVVVFARNAATGALTFFEVKRNGGSVDGLNGAYSVIVSPNGGHVYIVGGVDDALSVFSRDPISGGLTFVEGQKDGVGGVDGLDFVQSVAISPDNRHVYTGSGLDNAVAVFLTGAVPVPTATSTVGPDYLPLILKQLPPTSTPIPGTPTVTPPPGSGGRIAFVSSRDGNSEIYVMNADGSGQTRLTNNAASDFAPAWSPDGAKIVFVSTRDGNSEIYVMNADGSGQTRLTTVSESDAAPAWSPDGTKIAFTSYRSDNQGDIYVMNADGSAQANLTNHSGLDVDPAWSPDGAKIAFITIRTPSGIYTMNSDGSNPSLLVNTPRIEFSPAWSPDGTKIAFTSFNISGTLYGEVYTVNADGSGLSNLTNNPLSDTDPSWASDGARIVYGSGPNTFGGGYIYVMNADGTQAQRLTNNSAKDSDPAWRR
jgi:Tol biopolymer transport system component